MNVEHVRIVLVGTTHPGNIGSCARAMKTMGLSQLHLVAPERYPDPQATAQAAHADDVLEHAQVHADLDGALAGAGLVVGLSARPRNIDYQPSTARVCAQRVVAESGRHPVALLFGREHSGLSNAELDRCHSLVHIPANPDYSSLNLAAAVQVICYELRMAAELSPPAEAPAAEPAAAEHMEGLFGHFERMLQDTGYLDKRSPGLLLRRLRRILTRARPDEQEINLLRGILTHIQRNWRR